MRRGLLLLFIAAILPSTSLAQAGDAKVSVQLVSGRSFAGVLDARTDSERLWLRWSVGDVELQRPIAWERIKSVELNGTPIEVIELQEQAAKLATLGRTTQLRRASAAAPGLSLAISPAVRSIHCDAFLANWDADAAFDGLVLEIAALDEFGQVVAAQGTAEAELTTIDYQPAYLNSSSGGRVPTSLGHWSQGWNAPQKLRLELQARDPQRDGSLGRYAVLKVRVTIPGSGVFEQQIDGLRMRPFTPVQNAQWR
jgi:hypothetical protein